MKKEVRITISSAKTDNWKIWNYSTFTANKNDYWKKPFWKNYPDFVAKNSFLAQNKKNCHFVIFHDTDHFNDKTSVKIKGKTTAKVSPNSEISYMSYQIGLCQFSQAHPVKFWFIRIKTFLKTWILDRGRGKRGGSVLIRLEDHRKLCNQQSKI